jgi:hypothetical protein
MLFLLSRYICIYTTNFLSQRTPAQKVQLARGTKGPVAGSQRICPSKCLARSRWGTVPSRRSDIAVRDIRRVASTDVCRVISSDGCPRPSNGRIAVSLRRAEAEFETLGEDLFKNLVDDACIFVLLELLPEA